MGGVVLLVPRGPKAISPKLTSVQCMIAAYGQQPKPRIPAGQLPSSIWPGQLALPSAGLSISADHRPFASPFSISTERLLPVPKRVKAKALLAAHRPLDISTFLQAYCRHPP